MAKKEPSGQVAPTELLVGETYAVDGVRFKCIGEPRRGPDPKFVYVPSRKYRLRQIRPIAIEEQVDVFRI